MSSKVNVGDMEIHNLSAARFRERFKNIFEYDRALSEEDFDQILLEVDFNEGKALAKVVDRVRQPNQFPIPAFLLDSPSPDLFSTPINKRILSSQPIPSVEEYSPTGANKKRSALQIPIEDSDNELIFSNGSEERTSNRPSLSAFKETPKRVQSFIQCKALCELSEESDKDERRPMKKRRSATLSLRTARTSVSAQEARNEKNRDSDSKRRLQPKATKSFQSTSTLDSSGEENDLFTPSSRKRNGQSSKLTSTNGFDVDLSDTFDSDDEGESVANTEVSDSTENEVSRSGNKQAPQRSPRGQRGNQNDRVLKRRTKTAATPWLHRLAKPHFPTTLEEVPAGGLKPIEIKNENSLNLKRYLEDVRKKAWEHEVTKIEFIGPSIWQDDNDRLGYASVRIDGISYKPGDCVILRSTELDTPKKKSKTTALSQEVENGDKLLDPWYARLIYIYKNEHGEEMGHFRWFQAGAETAIGELATPRELFLLTQCNSSSLASIYRKIQVSNKSKGDSTSQNVSSVVELDLAGKDEYFYRLYYHIVNEQFTDAAMHEIHGIEYHGEQHCECCEIQAENSRNKKTRIIGATLDNGSKYKFEGFYHKGVDYHLFDFIYIFDDSLIPYRIGQINRIYLPRSSRYRTSSKPIVNNENLMIKVDLYDRYDKFYSTYYEEFQHGRRHAVRDERRLYKSERTAKILVDQIDGKCYVRHQTDIEDMEKYKDENDRFWVADKVSDFIHPGGVIRRSDLAPLPSDELKYADQTEADLAAHASRVETFLKYSRKLQALDIFAGAGGLSIGMHMSCGAIETLWAFEFSEAACNSLRKNLPNAKVYNVDGNELLDRAIRIENGEKLPPSLDCHGNVVPDLPRKGEVDFIFGGPPCPGFSMSNRYPKADDIRNSLVVLFLSFLDFYRPKYFLLENVKEILTYRLGATQVSVHKTEGGIERGMLKFILRAMTSIGYQCQFTVLQAAESRTRAIFWASKPGFPLPAFPQPTNVVKNSRQYSLSWHRTRRAAPLPTCTVGQAITDLPAFDWVNPHRVIPESKEQRSEREERSKTITQYECDANSFAGRDHQSYASHPLSEYQRKLGAGVRKDELFNHVTKVWDQRRTMVSEQASNVPLRPGADHRDLPRALTHWGSTSPDSAASRHGNYPGRIGRLDMEDISGTCTTKMDPNGKNGKVLHPTQYRVISLREYARIMSFPDSYIFDLDSARVDDIVRQLGNAVPPNFAHALARPLLDVLVDKFEEDQQTF